MTQYIEDVVNTAPAMIKKLLQEHKTSIDASFKAWPEGKKYSITCSIQLDQHGGTTLETSVAYPTGAKAGGTLTGVAGESGLDLGVSEVFPHPYPPSAE